MDFNRGTEKRNHTPLPSRRRVPFLRTDFRAWFFVPCLAALLLLAHRAPAAEPSAPAPQASAAAEKPPKVTLPERKLEFVVSEEPLEIPLMGLSGGVSWAAEFTSERPLPRSLELGSSWRQRAGATAEMAEESYYALQALWGQPDVRVLPAVVRTLAANAPESHRPPTDPVSQLEEEGRVVAFYLPMSRSPFRPNFGETSRRVFRVYASSSEEARRLADALVQLIDYGACYRIQQLLVVQKQYWTAELTGARASLAAAEQQRAGYAKELAAVDDIDENALRELKNQQRLTAVDIAGANARREACVKMLRARPSFHEQLETLKVTAEIELVGLTAKKEYLEQAIASGQRAVQLRATVAQTEKDVASQKSGVRGRESMLSRVEAAQKDFLPFPFKDDRVTIRPTKWAPSSNTPSRGF